MIKYTKRINKITFFIAIILFSVGCTSIPKKTESCILENDEKMGIGVCYFNKKVGNWIFYQKDGSRVLFGEYNNIGRKIGVWNYLYSRNGIDLTKFRFDEKSDTVVVLKYKDNVLKQKSFYSNMYLYGREYDLNGDSIPIFDEVNSTFESYFSYDFNLESEW